MSKSKLDSPWQPFETAPKDGNEFLAYRGRRVFAMHWRSEEAYWYTAWGEPHALPTHWQPMPAGPDAQELTFGEIMREFNSSDAEAELLVDEFIRRRT